MRKCARAVLPVSPTRGAAGATSTGELMATKAAKPTPKPVETPKTTAPKAGVDAPVKRARTDWDAVERDYRTAQWTLRELGRKHSVSHQAISAKIEKLGWTQDLSLAIKQATNASLVAALVTDGVASNNQSVANVVLAAAEINTRIILGHRIGLSQITEVKVQLLNQIRQAAANMVDLAEVIEMVRNPDDNGMDRANDALKKAMGRSALVDDLKKLADVDEKVRKGEREAFGLGTEQDTPPSAKRVMVEFVDVVPRYDN